MTDAIDPYSIAKRLLTFGEDWADKKAAADLLAETKKVVLAELATQSNESSATAKENYALRHPDYKKHVQDMVEAERKANKAKAKLQAEQVRIELMRTVSANERQINKVMP